MLSTYEIAKRTLVNCGEHHVQAQEWGIPSKTIRKAWNQEGDTTNSIFLKK